MVKKNNGRVPLAAAAACAGLLAAGCGAAAVYVPAGDPVLRACQAPDVQNVATLQLGVDDANNTDPGLNGSGTGVQLIPGQVTSLRHAAASYRVLAAGTGTHPRFTAALRDEAQEFTVAASSPTGLTTNTVAAAADKFSGEIQADCGAFRVGTAPQAGKPGPGIMNWGLFWAASLGYLAMALAAGYLIAVAQRAKPRKKRLSPGQISWLAAVWWVTIFTAAGGAYRQLLRHRDAQPGRAQG